MDPIVTVFAVLFLLECAVIWIRVGQERRELSADECYQIWLRRRQRR